MSKYGLSHCFWRLHDFNYEIWFQGRDIGPEGPFESLKTDISLLGQGRRVFYHIARLKNPCDKQLIVWVWHGDREYIGYLTGCKMIRLRLLVDLKVKYSGLSSKKQVYWKQLVIIFRQMVKSNAISDLDSIWNSNLALALFRPSKRE